MGGRPHRQGVSEAPLAGRVAIVTGVSRRAGIGFATASRLASTGADLFVHSFVQADAEQVWGPDPGGVAPILEELRRTGRRVEHADADFMDPVAPDAIVDAAQAAFGHVDIVVANHARSSLQSLEELTSEDIDASFAVNARATMLLIKGFADRHDDARPGGRIVMLTSGQHRGPMARELGYAASKGALHQLTRSLAAHLAPRAITVNTVNPGPTDTGWASPEEHRSILAGHPRGRWGTPEDAARLIAWLCTGDAEWVTGQVIDSEGRP
jgi:3-oxoacyl-[acyl-carrier protein] reductase